MDADKKTRDANSMQDVVDGIEDIAERNDDICVRDVVSEFGDRSFGPFMLILAVIGMSPVGGVPGVPSFIALSIALVAGQMVFGREHIWLPGFIENRSTGSQKLLKAKEKLGQLARWLDSIAKGRLRILAQGPALQIAAALIIVLCCLVPLLELFPFAAAIPFLSIAIVSLAMIVRDGVVMLVGGLAAAAAMGGGIVWSLA